MEKLDFSGGSAGKRIRPSVQEVGSIRGSEDPLEKMATHSVFLPEKSHGQEDPGELQSMGSQKCYD